MKYYVTMDADSVADELWGRDWEAGNNRRAGNTFGNNAPPMAGKQKQPPPTHRRKPLTIMTLQAEGTGLEPATPLLGHHISSVAANHSLTLQPPQTPFKSAISWAVRQAVVPPTPKAPGPLTTQLGPARRAAARNPSGRQRWSISAFSLPVSPGTLAVVCRNAA